MSKATNPCTEDSVILYDDLPEELYFFAYGANMNQQQIRERCRHARVVTKARLPCYRIGFFGNSRIWDGAQASVVRESGQEVWGVVYELSTTDLERLDAWQDVRMDGTGPYFHYPVKVTGTDGRIYLSLLYEKSILGEPQKPSAPYLDFIVAGAEAHQLPAAYIQALKSMPAKRASYQVPRPRLYNPESLLAWDCSSCEE